MNSPTAVATRQQDLRLPAALMLGAVLTLAPMAAPAQTTPAPADAAAQPAASSEAAAAPAPADAAAPPAAGQFRQAGATLHNAEGGEVGAVIITETASGVMHLIMDIGEGTLPATQHAVHIHETGACEAPTFDSAGGHLAGGKEHGLHSAKGIHPGDLPNITMYESGAVHVEYFLPGVLMDQVLDGDGSAIMIHSGVDDYTSQPAGNAGDRIACGVLAAPTN